MGIGDGLSAPSRKAVFLDRDGVINRTTMRDGKPRPPAGVTEVEILPRVDEALEKLKEAGFLTIVVTNQPDVTRGTQQRDTVEQINSFLKARLSLDAFFVCWHDDGDRCSCRKPLPGLLFAARDEYSVDLSRSYMVGDRGKDIEAGRRAGCTTILIDYGYQEPGVPYEPDMKAASLFEAAEWIVGHGGAD